MGGTWRVQELAFLYRPLRLTAELDIFRAKFFKMIACILGCLLLGTFSPIAEAQVPGEKLAAALEESINRAIEFLKRSQQADGSWPDPVNMPCGMTSLCTLALLSAGVPPDDPAVAKALRYLLDHSADDINKTYPVALQTMVYCRADPSRYLPQIQENVQWLAKTQIQGGSDRGGWSYPGSNADNSNSQFAVLALYEAERAGARVPDAVWTAARQYWESGQNADGSWGYRQGQPGTGSMTCAGITSLIIIYDVVRQPAAKVDDQNRINCCQPAPGGIDRIQRGLNWLARHFTVRQNPQGGNTWIFYYLYGLERVGRLSALRFIGQHDWYREGSAFLLELKATVAPGGVPTDFWVGPNMESDPLLATSFALLFLAKGRRPILLSKIRLGPEQSWNSHPNDVYNLTTYTESRWKMDLGWQILDITAASVEDLLQSPVLYLGGTDSPLPSDPATQKRLAEKIRDYVDRGGFLLAEATCPQGNFDKGFRQLMALAFPEPEYTLQMLPPEHPIWRAEEAIPPQFLRPLLGIEFGCRTSVVYAPAVTGKDGRFLPSLSCLWELHRLGRGVTLAPSVAEEVKAGVNLGVNILAYATNRQLKYKYEFFERPSLVSAQDTVARDRIAVAQLLHPGGCHVAPRALNNLLEAAAEQLRLRVDLAKYEINITDPALFDFHLAFMHGRNAFRLTDDERQQLRVYLERGGMILADAVCANRAFAESFRREFATLIPDHPLQPIPPDDPIYTTAYGGFDVRFVTRRDPQPVGPESPAAEALRRVPPELEGIRIDDRWAVIFSPYDLSCALERQQTVGCRGYTPEDAARLGINILLYSLQQ